MHWFLELQSNVIFNSIYTQTSETSFLMLSVHVDDQLIACNSRGELNSFKRELNSEFKCSEGESISYLLGMNIYQDWPAQKLYISQEHYINSILERFNMLQCKPAKTTLPSNFWSIPATTEEFKEARHPEYPAMVGSITVIRHRSSQKCRGNAFPSGNENHF